MKYLLLAAWVRENRKLNSIVEAVTLSEGNAIFHLSGSVSLVCHYKTSNPFPFLNPAPLESSRQSNQIWHYLNDASLSNITIRDNDRILVFELCSRDIYNSSQNYYLIFECMPPCGNLILCQKQEKGLVIKDALIKYTYAENQKRQILPGLLYEAPSTGFVPDAGNVRYPLLIESATDEKALECNDMNSYFLAYYEKVVLRQAAEQEKHKLKHYWQKELSKAEKKSAQQQKELQDAELVDKWLLYAETIKTNLNRIKKGDEVLEAINYYDPQMSSITIPLWKDKSATENLKYYLKKYSKSKQGIDKISRQLELTRKEIQMIGEILVKFETEAWRSLPPIDAGVGKASELIRQVENLLRIQIDEHWEILIGRKATENDRITTQLAKPWDWWFHTRIYHGSHILLRNFHKLEPPEKYISICCGLAAWFSKARNSQNVPVDYTQIRFVRKPRKSAPGFVTYSSHKTIFADPLEIGKAREMLQTHG